MKKKYFLTSVIMIIMLFSLTGCGNNKNEDTFNNKSKTTNTLGTITNTTKETNNDNNIDYKTAAEKQMAMPNQGDTVATIHVKNFGDIKVKFFPEVAPKAVENFTTHAKEGYYNGLTFHRVIDEFMIQGGDPKGDGTGGESIWGEGFGVELNDNLVPYRGSLCMAMSSQPNSIGSQFFITQANYNEQTSNLLKTYYNLSDNLLEQYKEYGGYLSLYKQYTVFGQVYEGMDVVDKIAKVETHTTENGQEDKPVEDVVIENIEVTTYSNN